MAINEGLKQCMKCRSCSNYDDCTDIEAKLKEAFDQPLYRMSKFFPSKGISGQPYKSKYFDDHRYDPPRPLTICDLEKYLFEEF